MKSQNPFGLHSVTPYLMLDDAGRLIDFLKTTLDAELRGEVSYRDDGSVMHAELKIGDSVVMIGEPMEDLPPYKTGLYVYVDDCDKRYDLALKNGAVSVSEPTDFPHGDRYGGVKDFAGNIWWLVTHVGK